MIDWMTIGMALQVGAMWAAVRFGHLGGRRADRLPADVMMLNWFGLSIVWALAGGAVPVPIWMLADFLCGVWLISRSAKVAGVVVGLCFAPMVIWNGISLIFGEAPGPVLNWLGLVQSAALLWSVWGDGLGEVAGAGLDRLGRWLGRRSADPAGGQAFAADVEQKEAQG